STHTPDIKHYLDKNNAQYAETLRQLQKINTLIYELNEYPIPRLFIVLPKERRYRDNLRPFTKQFRLFFLCEYGAHTKTDDGENPHNLHLAKHEGYDLNLPSEFFKKFGPYVLAVMKLIKTGTTVAGIVVPPLGHLGLVEGIDAVQKALDFMKDNIRPLVGQAIECITSDAADSEPEMTNSQTVLDNIKPLDGADLRRLESYLIVHDKGRAFGNLKRIKTDDGHVEWVCMDHCQHVNHHRHVDEPLVKEKLRIVIDKHGGRLDQDKIEIKIRTREDAREFYRALFNARCVRELSIQPLWDAALSDLRTFKSAMSEANIERVAMDGSAFQGPLLDIWNHHRRFNPIIELMANGRIESLRLVEFKDFYQRVQASMMSPSPKLQVLTLDFRFALHGPAKSVFKKIVQNCPALTELRCKCDPLSDVFKCIEDSRRYIPRLKLLILKGSGLYCKVNRYQDSISRLHATLYWFECLSLSDHGLLYSGQLTTLTVSRIQNPGAMDKPMDEILKKNTKLKVLCIMSDVGQYHSIVELIKSKRTEVRSQRGESALRKLVLSLPSDIADHVEDTVVHMVVTFEDSTCDIVTDVKMRSTEASGNGIRGLDHIFHFYGGSIQRLHTTSDFNDSHASLLAETLKIGQSKLTNLSVNPSRLTSKGLDCVKQIVKHSKHLNALAVSFDLRVGHEPRVAKGTANWIAAMVKRSPSFTTSSDHTSTAAEESWTPLNDVRLEYMELHPKEWQTVLGAMDFSTLKSLSVEHTNFAFAQLKHLDDECVQEGDPLRRLRVRDADLVQTVNQEALREMTMRLRGKARHLKIIGLS
ncbi:hypothetical protein BGZ68_009649, partial [Mortierella alpina]